MLTIATYPEPTRAHIAKALLESEGIPCRVVDEFTAGAYWLLSNAIGGVKLQVAPEDMDRARAILEEDRSASLGETSPALEPESRRCGRCGSADLRPPQVHRWSAVVSLLLWLPLFVRTRSWTCLSCGHRASEHA